MNKDNAISKINKIGKAGSIISKIAMICLTVGVVAAIIGGIFFLSVPKEDFVIKLDDRATLTLNTGTKLLGSVFGINTANVSEQIASGSMELNGTEYSFVDADYDESSKALTFALKSSGTTITAGRFALVAWFAAAYAAINIVLFFFVKKLCDSLRQCRSPFEADIITGIQRCAWAMIPWAVLGSFGESVMSTAFTNNIQFSLDLNITAVLAILLLFGLAYVFKYGAVLQTESDETL